MNIRQKGISTLLKATLWGVALIVAFVVLAPSASAQLDPLSRQLRSNRQVIRGGMVQKRDTTAIDKRDSLATGQKTDSLTTSAIDSLVLRTDSLAVSESDSLRTASLAALGDSLAVDSTKNTRLTEREVRRKERRENRKPLLSDSMSLRKVCFASAVLPGFGQIYNKQYWKLPILYSTVGASIGMCIYEHNKYAPLKREFDAITDQSMLRTEKLNALQRDMIKHNTLKQVFMVTAIASYLYFIGDAAVCYSTNEVSSVQKATTLAMICPGAGQVYNKSYWRVPIVIGGFATTIYCIDWNNRGYERFKKAYRLRADYDANPDAYPNGSQDEFKGRYSGTFLKNLRNSYRRNRDLCIILTAGLYILQIVDAHVDAHLRDYDISDNLSVEVTPMVNCAYNPVMRGADLSVGMNVCFTF